VDVEGQAVLPAGLQLLTRSLPIPAGAPRLGVPTTPGLCAFAVQAVDGLNFGERTFSMRVSPTQISVWPA
jgi:hypothetical protein